MIVADAITGTSGEALSKYRLLKVSSATTPATYKYCQPGEQPIGTNDEAVAADERITINLLNRLGSLEVEAHEAITQHANVYPGPAGRVAASGIGRPIGIAMKAASAQGDIIDILPLNALLAPAIDEFAVYDDFIGMLLTGAEAPWTAILTDSGTRAVLDAAGGVMQLEASDGTIGDNDEAYNYSTNEVFKVAAGKSLFFESRVKLGAADTDNANVMVGVLSGVAANAILDNGGGPPASYDGIVVFKKDGGTAWEAEISVAGTQTAITLTSPGAPGASYQKIGILVVPTTSALATAYIFVDGVLVGSQAFTFTGMTEMAAFVGVKNGGTTVNTTLHVDYVLCRQAR